jgi:hypothetical protein
MNASRTTNTKSASKSILSLLIGIAIDREYISSVDQTLDEFFPEHFESNPDPVKASISHKGYADDENRTRNHQFSQLWAMGRQFRLGQICPGSA